MASEIDSKSLQFYPSSRKKWRAWLEKNHNRQKHVWLIRYKKISGKLSVDYEEAVEEALCFGWIDSKSDKRDDESFFLYFAKRKPKSDWSRLNKNRVEKLSAAGLMTEAGLAAIAEAKKNGHWTALDEVEDMVMPADLIKAFAKNKTALKNFNAFPPSAKKGILNWIRSARKEETRIKRISGTVMQAKKNVRAN